MSGECAAAFNMHTEIEEGDSKHAVIQVETRGVQDLQPWEKGGTSSFWIAACSSPAAESDTSNATGTRDTDEPGNVAHVGQLGLAVVGFHGERRDDRRHSACT